MEKLPEPGAEPEQMLASMASTESTDTPFAKSLAAQQKRLSGLTTKPEPAPQLQPVHEMQPKPDLQSTPQPEPHLRPRHAPVTALASSVAWAPSEPHTLPPSPRALSLHCSRADSAIVLKAATATLETKLDLATQQLQRVRLSGSGTMRCVFCSTNATTLCSSWSLCVAVHGCPCVQAARENGWRMCCRIARSGLGKQQVMMSCNVCRIVSNKSNDTVSSHSRPITRSAQRVH
jgi:hypothetical protein